MQAASDIDSRADGAQDRVRDNFKLMVPEEEGSDSEEDSEEDEGKEDGEEMDVDVET